MRRNQPLLGTFVTITAYGKDKELTQAAVGAAFDEFRHVDALMSIHRADSEISRVNRSAAAGPVKVSEELFLVLAKAQEISRQTDGAFDISVGPLTQLWGFIWKEYRLPTAEELEGVLPRVGWRHVELNRDKRTVRFLRDGMSLDLGGIAKGYAVDRAMDRLRELGVRDAMVKAGGDLRVAGLPPGENGWEVQLEDPAKEGNRTTIRLRTGALSTSGNYENFFIANGRRYSHIVDPRTGVPVEDMAACTLRAETCMESDAWATACFVMGVERSLGEFGGRFPMRLTVVEPGGESFKHRATARFLEN